MRRRMRAGNGVLFPGLGLGFSSYLVFWNLGVVYMIFNVYDSQWIILPYIDL